MSLLPFAMLGVKQASASPKALSPHAPIQIDGPGNFTASNGVTGGSGSPNDPYIIQGWSIDASRTNGIEIRNILNPEGPVPPPAFFVIRNVFIHSETEAYADIVLDSDASPPDLSCFECPGNIFPGVISNSTLTGNADGIILHASNNILVSGVTVHDSHTGVYLLDSAFLNIRGNRIADSGTGINISSSLVDVFHNTIVNTDNGIFVGSYASLDIEHNYITSPRGFTLDGSGTVIAMHNRIIGSSGPTVHLYEYGVSEYQTGGVNLQNNTITNNTPTNPRSGPAGINITSSSSAFVAGNTVQAGNSYGIVLHNSSGGSVYHNNLLNNTIQAFDDNPSVNLWDNGYPSGGNFWSDFTGVDNCSGPQQNICPSPDGIGDAPYAFSFNTDRYPLMKPFQ